MATINVPADYADIQTAITNASNGDVIVVADGEYSGTGSNCNLSLQNKSLTIESANGPKRCRIEGGTVGFVKVPGSGTSVVDGFTIDSSYSHGWLGYVISSTGLTFKNCICRGCSGSRGAVSTSTGTVTLINVLVHGCDAPYHAAMGYIYSSGTVNYTNCTGYYNPNSYALRIAHASATVNLKNCAIWGHTTSSIYNPLGGTVNYTTCNVQHDNGGAYELGHPEFHFLIEDDDPGVDDGTADAAVTTDIYGVARDASLDIGCFEYT